MPRRAIVAAVVDTIGAAVLTSIGRYDDVDVFVGLDVELYDDLDGQNIQVPTESGACLRRFTPR